MSKVTLQVDFTDSSLSTAFVLPEFDKVKNLDADGNLKSEFYQDDSIFLAVCHDDTVKVKEIIPTLNGLIRKIGTASRTEVQRIFFKGPTDKVSLSYIPDGGVAVSWYGRDSEIVQDGQVVTARPGYAIADVSYNYTVVLYSFQLGVELGVSVDEKYPLGFTTIMEAA